MSTLAATADSTVDILHREAPAVRPAPPRPTEVTTPPAKAEAGKGGGKRRALLIAVPIFLAAIVGGVMWWLHARQFEGTDDAFVEGRAHPISSRLAGNVAELLVADNQEVAAGQPILRLDARDFEVARRQARAALTEAEAGVPQAEALLAQAQAQLRASEANVSQAQAQRTKAGLDFARSQQLFQSPRSGVISRADFDAAQAAFDVTRATTLSAEAAKEAAAAAVRSAEAALASSRARVETATASLAQADLQLSYATIPAPAAGRVGKRTVEAGQRLSPGQQVLAVVGRETWVVANFKESQLSAMRAGQPVTVTIDAIEGKTFIGRVDSFSPGTGAKFALLPPDNATGNFTKIVQRVPVKIVLDADSARGFEDRISPGLSAYVKVRIAHD